MSELTCSCPHCGQELNVESDFAGQAVACPACNGEFEVPEAPHAPTPILPNAPALAASPRLYLPGAAPGQPQAPPQYQQPPSPAYLQPPPVYQPPPQAAGAPGYGAAVYPGYPHRGGIGDALSNPLEGQPRAIQGLGPGGSLGWGIALCSIWVIAIWGVLARMSSQLATYGAPKASIGDHFEWIFRASIIAVMLILTLCLLKVMAGKAAGFGAIVFTSGMVMIPLSVTALTILCISFAASETQLRWDLDPGQIGHVLLVFFAFSFSAIVLLTKASLVSVIGYSRAVAFWLVPTTLVVVAYLTYWTQLLLDEMFKS